MKCHRVPHQTTTSFQQNMGMKHLLLLILLVSSSHFGMAQSPEFKTYATGLMYSDSIMSQLEHIVDSLNIKFRSCDLDRTYYTTKQGKAHYIRLEDNAADAAQKDIESGISFEAFLKKYPSSNVKKDLLVINYQYTNYKDENTVEFMSMIEERRVSFNHQPQFFSDSHKNQWIVDYHGSGEFTKENLEAFYFTAPLKSTTIPENYARLIQYTDCMIDTNGGIFEASSIRRTSDDLGYKESKVTAFMEYIQQEIPEPEFDLENYEAYKAKYRIWDSTKFTVAKTKLVKTQKFKTMLDEAVKDALVNGWSNDYFEEYVARFYSKETALQLKRSRKVWGTCSMDNSPRIHARNIAMLSAETVNWEVFLRAHLDIMNDNFSRASDGNYALARRETYILELEELDINVADLLLGISLRMENPSQNHYYGSIRRLGRALSESKNAKEIETRILEMIADNSLDDYNRLLMYYLFLNYNHYEQDDSQKSENQKQLKNAVEQMPEYLAVRLEKK